MIIHLRLSDYGREFQLDFVWANIQQQSLQSYTYITISHKNMLNTIMRTKNTNVLWCYAYNSATQTCYGVMHIISYIYVFLKIKNIQTNLTVGHLGTIFHISFFEPL